MNISRRELMVGLATLPASRAVSAVVSSDLPHSKGTVALPDKASFVFDGVYLNAAYTHPLGVQAYAAAEDFLQARRRGLHLPIGQERS